MKTSTNICRLFKGGRVSLTKKQVIINAIGSKTVENIAWKQEIEAYLKNYMYLLFTIGRNEVYYIRCTKKAMFIEKLKHCTLQISVFIFWMDGKYHTILNPYPNCYFVIYHVKLLSKNIILLKETFARVMKCNLPMICNLMVANRTSNKKYNHHLHHHHRQHCNPLSTSSMIHHSNIFP